MRVHFYCCGLHICFEFSLNFCKPPLLSFFERKVVTDFFSCNYVCVFVSTPRVFLSLWWKCAHVGEGLFPLMFSHSILKFSMSSFWANWDGRKILSYFLVLGSWLFFGLIHHEVPWRFHPSPSIYFIGPLCDYEFFFGMWGPRHYSVFSNSPMGPKGLVSKLQVWDWR